MRTILAFIKASRYFLSALVGRRDAVLSYSTSGYSALAGWDRVPEDLLIEDFRSLSRSPERSRRGLLVGLEGQHAGESFSLPEGESIIGSDLAATVVPTPKPGTPEARYAIHAAREVELRTELGAPASVNGSVHKETHLFDYDEIEWLGNRFLFLDTSRDLFEAGLQRGQA